MSDGKARGGVCQTQEEEVGEQRAQWSVSTWLGLKLPLTWRPTLDLLFSFRLHGTPMWLTLSSTKGQGQIGRRV